MVEFAMPTAEKLVVQLNALRRDVVPALDEGTPAARKALNRFDRLIARYDDQ